MISNINQFLEKARHAFPDLGIFKSGECASLALALYDSLHHANPSEELSINIIYRLERDIETDIVEDKVISHVMLGTSNDCFDIKGNNADERWEEHLDTVEPYKGYYNDTEYETISGYNVESRTREICKEYSMSFNTLDTLKNIFKASL